MLNKALTYLQYLLPQHCLSTLAGYLANIQEPRIKNMMINKFIKTYQIDMQAAAKQNANDYPTFNDFFIRLLKDGSRPIAPDIDQIVSPADGVIAQLGNINQDLLVQAKNMYFTLNSLLAYDMQSVDRYNGGKFATIYLAPHNYHRVHMPLTGKLIKTIYVPGKLFSVNKMTSSLIPNLYSRNERLICEFETAAGPMAVILVGALIVGSMQTTWMSEPMKNRKIITTQYPEGKVFEKGSEIGHFKLGSTVIILFGKDRSSWKTDIYPDLTLQYGEYIGNTTN